MSGIAGISYFDKQPVTTEEVDKLASAIIHRGSDGIKTWHSGSVGMAHSMLHTTPESLTETLPFCDSNAGITITADARIDNREELTGLLAMPTAKSRKIADSQFILEAYKKWGEECAARLTGDFSFAIWDEHRQQFYCARDHMGIKPFYYHLNQKCFLFSSEIQPILDTSKNSFSLNRQRIIDYIVFLYSTEELTFYSDIFRLPPSSSMTVANGNKRIWKHFSFSPDKETKLNSDKEYEEAFQEIFSQAVSHRLRSAFPTGSALSGGLDSSSITCVARNLLHTRNRPPLHTFSAIFPNLPPEQLKLADESKYMQEVIQQGEMISHMVRADLHNPVTTMLKNISDEPNPTFNLYMHEAMFEEAQKNNVRVFLDGLDGDTTVSHGYEHLYDLARTFRFSTLFRETRALNKEQGAHWTKVSTVKTFIVKPWIPSALWQFARNLTKTTYGDETLQAKGLAMLCHDQLPNRFLPRRIRHLYEKGNLRTPGRRKHFLSFLSPVWSHYMRVMDCSSATYKLECRYPFWDRQLMEFCLSLPGNQKLRNGFTRSILRRSMAGILPENVRTRPGKANLSPNFIRCMQDLSPSVVNDHILSNQLLFGYLDQKKVSEFYNNRSLPAKDSEPIDAMFLFILLALGAWIQNTQTKKDMQPLFTGYIA